jgi:hypothetical protein
VASSRTPIRASRGVADRCALSEWPIGPVAGRGYPGERVWVLDDRATSHSAAGPAMLLACCDVQIRSFCNAVQISPQEARKRNGLTAQQPPVTGSCAAAGVPPKLACHSALGLASSVQA